METRLLLVEDEDHLARGLRFNFEAEGYEVEHFPRAEPALSRLCDPDAPPAHLLVLDVMLPGMSGLELLERVRPELPSLPVLLLTARDAERDIVAGLDAGADDYLTKPFSLPVLMARVRSLLRRSPPDEPPSESECLTIGDVHVYPSRFEIERNGERQALTEKELGLLSLLYARRGEAVSRGDILEEVWDLDPKTRTRVVDTFILRLRKLIEPDPSQPQHLLSVRSYGYRLTDE